MALLRRAREVSPTEAGTADRLLALAEKRLHAATQSSQANANTWYRAAQGLLLVAQARAASNAATQPTIDAANTALLTSAKEACAKALAVTKSHDVEFVQLRVLQSQIAVAQGDPAAARATLNDTIAQRPDAVPARIAMAELLSNSDGEAAIQILDRAKSIPGIEPGPAALRHQSELVEATIVAGDALRECRCNSYRSSRSTGKSGSRAGRVRPSAGRCAKQSDCAQSQRSVASAQGAIC